MASRQTPLARPDQGQAGSSARSDVLRVCFDEFELDEAEARLTRDGEPVRLAPKALAVLCALARRQQSLVKKNALLDAVWGHQFVSESVLKTTISELRGALGDDPKAPRYIETVSRHGYRFIGAVRPPSSKVPTAVTAVLARTIPTTPAPATVTGASAVLPRLTGRSEALARLRQAWDAACAGKRQLVWVTGEPGIGKTTLVEHFVTTLGDVSLAHGECVEQYGAGEPYLPVLEALADLCRRDPDVVPLLRTVAPTWLLQLPWLSDAAEREALRRELAGATQARMLREMGELLDRYNQHKPLLLVTENLHWSDHATVQLIDHIARRRGGARLMWLATFRVADVIATDHPLGTLRHELRLHGLSEEIMLDAFSQQDVAAYLAVRSPALAGDEELVRALHERTDGLPLFVADVVGDLLAQDAASAGAASSARQRLASAEIPENLAGIIEQYVRRLGPEQRALLDAASVCGMEFRPGTLAEVLQRDAAAVAAACAELARRQQWLTEPPADSHPAELGYAFRHAIYRQVLYQRIAPFARVELHRKVGAALDRDRAAGAAVSASELASHFEQGGEALSALRCYAEAAESALQRFSPSEAMGLTELALALLPDAPDGEARTGMEITLAALQGVSALRLRGLLAPEVERALWRGQALLGKAPLHPARGLLLNALGVVLVMRGDFERALALAEQSEALYAASKDPTLLVCSCVVQGMVHHLRGRPRVGREWLERGLAALATLEDEAPYTAWVTEPGVMMLSLLGIQLLLLGFVDQGRARMRAAHARADRLNQPMARLVVLWSNALFELRIDNAQRVGELGEQIGALADEHAMAHGRPAHRWFRAWAQMHAGDPRGAHRLIREGYAEMTRPGNVMSFSEVLGYGAEALVLAGDWDGAQRELDDAMQVARTVGERVYLVQLLLLEARVADARGEPARAREWIERALSEAREQEARWLELTALVALCERRDGTAEEWRAFTASMSEITEGLDTPLVTRARALLEARQV